MADINIQSEERIQLNAGEVSFVEYSGTANFPTTSKEANFAVRLDTITSFQLTLAGAAAADEQLFVKDAATGGVITPTTGVVVISRGNPAAATSALAFSYTYRGYGE